jgi:hypothetical protein
MRNVMAAWLLTAALATPAPSAGSFESEMLASHNAVRPGRSGSTAGVVG